MNLFDELAFELRTHPLMSNQLPGYPPLNAWKEEL
jgi:hypothetical protein